MPGDRPCRRATEKGDELPSSHRCPMPSSIPYHIVEQEPRCTSQQIRWVDDRFGSFSTEAANSPAQPTSASPRKRPSADKPRCVVKGQFQTYELRRVAA